MLKKVINFCVVVLIFCSAGAQADLPDFTELIEKNSPAVVKIEVEGKQPTARDQEQMELLRRFFGQRGGIPRQRPRGSMGSGFVVSKDGYVLTNNHVIDQAGKIIVRFNDREEYQAEIVGTDPSTDLALLKIDADNLTTVKFGNSEDLKVGEWVVAIGSPFGLDYSASVGVVSAIGRSIPTERREDFVPFIQTDVAINPGNSGGPLFNLDGKVVGINSQIYTRSGGSNGISFSIPAHVATRVVAQLKDGGSVQRGFFGITPEPIDKNLAEAFGLKKAQGVLVSEVAEGQPADKAGIQEDDIITEIDGKKIVDLSDLFHVIANIAPGEEVDVALIREGKKKTVSVEVGVRPELASSSATSGGDRLGLLVSQPDQATLAQWRLRYGVKVDQVIEGSHAEKAGLVAGDIIVKVGRVPVTSVEEYRRLVQRLPEQKRIAVKIYRDGRSAYTTVWIDK